MTLHILKRVTADDEIRVSSRASTLPGLQLNFGNEIGIVMTWEQAQATVDYLNAYIRERMAGADVIDLPTRAPIMHSGPPEPPRAA